jgi:hypothetical protein
MANGVAIEPGVPCWSHHASHDRRYNVDPASREGRYNLDPVHPLLSNPPYEGSLCQVNNLEIPSCMCIMWCVP